VKLDAVVHLELPPLPAAAGVRHVDDQERVWIDELKLRDDALDGHPAAAVVDTRNRMMRVGRRPTDGNQRGDGKRPPLHSAILSRMPLLTFTLW
jgi:hypothetical protein